MPVGSDASLGKNGYGRVLTIKLTLCRPVSRHNKPWAFIYSVVNLIFYGMTCQVTP